MNELLPDLSEKQIKIGYWWLENKVKARAVLWLAILVVVGSFYVIAGYQLIKYINSSDDYEAMLLQMSQNITNYELIKKVSAPQPLVVENVNVIKNKDGSVDVAVKVKNPNQRWYLKNIDYHFNFAGNQTKMNNTSVLPGEEKYFYIFNVTDMPEVRQPDLILGRHIWHRIKDLSQINQQGLWVKPSFEISNLNYQKNIVGHIFSEVSFDLTNQNHFNFWNIEAQAALWQGQTLVGFNTILLTDVESGKVKPIKIVWNEDLPSNVVPKVIISANSLDETNIKQYQESF